MANLGKEFNDLLFTMPFQVPQDFIYLGRSVSILSGLCTSLDPSFNPWSEIQPYTQKILTQRLLNGGSSAGGSGSVISLPTLQNLVGVGQQLITRAITPQASPNDVLARIQRGDLTLRVDPSPAYQRQLERIEAQNRRTTRAVVFGSLLITSTIFATSGQAAPAVIGYGLTAITLLWTWFSGS
jgi:predicted unusual protein kinase regulating ubiquinone biosynthesis (AarF/ABC1/UbiB family)